ncbi:hypothetical protein DL767_009315 [Monosporascus sp. MG133]|nr:hypothetical protein DL767_009315 [Monosporascus sp. MG133]
MVTPRRSPYKKVEVRGLVWEGHDHQKQQGLVRNADQELNMVLNAFRDYSYNRLVSYASSTANLIILYYQGHGRIDKHGHLSLSNGNGQKIHWADIVNAITNVKCDVLAILNCYHAGAAIKSRVTSRPNYEKRVKQVMTAVPADLTSSWGTGTSFAACLEQALRDRRNNWESPFKGIPYHWAQAINLIMKKKKPNTHGPARTNGVVGS